ncbi:MAG: energy-coupling factor transporter transmembrane component T [Christensenellales bacterium]|jgi:energy-coupling factor transporter transmembrane protein EcfT
MEWAKPGKHRGLWLDPRSKILLMITVGLVTILSGASPMMNILKIVLAMLPFLLMLAAGEVRRALICFSAYVACYAATILLLPHMRGFLNLMLSAIVVIFTRFLPVVMMAWYTISTTKISEFMAAMERMHITQKLVIPLSVVFRFLPTVKEEVAFINDAMRMRGVQFGGGKAGDMLEYRLIPMMICSVKIGEELSAAALTRGLGAPVKRTNICSIGLGAADFLMIALCIFSLVCLVLTGTGVV